MFWDGSGSTISVQSSNGCIASDFDQYGDMEAFGAETKKKKEKKDREKEKERAKETIHYSGSSFEVGSLTVSPETSKTGSKSLGKKKTSILGLGLPSTI